MAYNVVVMVKFCLCIRFCKHKLPTTANTLHNHSCVPK